MCITGWAPSEQGPRERNSTMHDLTGPVSTGHWVMLMLLKIEMAKGFKFSPKFQQLHFGAKAPRTSLKAKLLFAIYFHFYFHLYQQILHMKETKQNSVGIAKHLSHFTSITRHQAAASVTKTRIEQKPQEIIWPEPLVFTRKHCSHKGNKMTDSPQQVESKTIENTHQWLVLSSKDEYTWFTPKELLETHMQDIKFIVGHGKSFEFPYC